MVYRGKPSTACEACRRRRIKCDKKQPCCSQCFNIGQICPGYRKQIDLLFQDENEHVIRRATKKAIHSNQSASAPPSGQSFNLLQPTSSELITPPAPHSSAFEPLGITRSPIIPIEDVAVTHFLGSCIQGSHFSYLSGIYDPLRNSTPIFAATHAASIATLSRELQDPRLMDLARRQYCHALEATNKAISTPHGAVSDQTLASVLLLCHFERTAHDRFSPSYSWTNHLQGAAKLLLLRGVQPLHTPVGRQLFVQVGINLRASAIERGERIPDAFLELRRQANGLMAEDMNPMLALVPVTDALVELKATMREGGFEDDAAVIDAALRVDRTARELPVGFPSHWRYEVQPGGHNQAEIPVHRYAEPCVAQLWNAIRMIRIYLNQLIYKRTVRQIDEQNIMGDGSTPLQLTELRNTAQGIVHIMALEICASVPQFVHHIAVENDTASTTYFSPIQSSSVGASAGFLLRPLSLAGGTPLAPAAAQQFAAKYLPLVRSKAWLPAEVGVAELFKVATTEGHSVRDDWLHMYQVF